MSKLNYRDCEIDNVKLVKKHGDFALYITYTNGKVYKEEFNKSELNYKGNPIPKILLSKLSNEVAHGYDIDELITVDYDTLSKENKQKYDELDEQCEKDYIENLHIRKRAYNLGAATFTIISAVSAISAIALANDSYKLPSLIGIGALGVASVASAACHIGSSTTQEIINMKKLDEKSNQLARRLER